MIIVAVGGNTMTGGGGADTLTGGGANDVFRYKAASESAVGQRGRSSIAPAVTSSTYWRWGRRRYRGC